MKKKYSLILIVVVFLLSAVILLQYPVTPPSEEGMVILIHAAEKGDLRIAEGEEGFDPLYEECMAVLSSLNVPIEYHVLWDDLSERMGEDESAYVALVPSAPMNIDINISGTITTQGAVFALHDLGPDCIEVYMIFSAHYSDGSPWMGVGAYDSARGLDRLSDLVNATLQGGGTAVGN